MDELRKKSKRIACRVCWQSNRVCWWLSKMNAGRRVFSQHYDDFNKQLKGKLQRTTSNIRSNDYQLVIMRRIPYTFSLGISFRLQLKLDRMYAL